MKITRGTPEPLGTNITPKGVNFAIYSKNATAIEICTYSEHTQEETGRYILPFKTDNVYHAHIEGIAEGTLYGIRAYGEYAPEKGMYFDPDKLLLDPYATNLTGPIKLCKEMIDKGDTSHLMPKAIISRHKNAKEMPIKVTPEKRVVYEMHVKGFSKNNKKIPEELRGTFLGLCHPSSIKYLKNLGINTVEILPPTTWVDEGHLAGHNLTNYWGYNPIAFMAPDPKLAPNGWDDVRTCVETLYENGIETIIDMVFNHTGEGDEKGPTVCFRGLDNATYYRMTEEGFFVNDAGTGNILDADESIVRRLVIDTLQTWKKLGGVHGVRFDLGSVLGRHKDGFNKYHPLLMQINDDRIIRNMVLISEPWDCGMGGYQLGNFPGNFSEWNGEYRDVMRSFWRGDEVSLGSFVQYFCGTQNLYYNKCPTASVNFINAHDGFTLYDLVSYTQKHNDANGEENRDGHNDNISWNNGQEGETEDLNIIEARKKDMRALMTILLLSRGMPMFPMGSEIAHSQGGNNNAYCQDNEISWLNFENADNDLYNFVKYLIKVRKKNPAFNKNAFFTGTPHDHQAYKDIEFFNIDGSHLNNNDWDNPKGQSIGIIITEDEISKNRIYLLINRSNKTLEAKLPMTRNNMDWQVIIDTNEPLNNSVVTDVFNIVPRSIVVLSETINKNKENPKPKEEDLNHLATLLGINLDWYDISGNQTLVPYETKQSIIEAMGYKAQTQQDVIEAIHRFSRKYEQRITPHYIAFDEDEEITIEVKLPIYIPKPTGLVTVVDENYSESKRPIEIINQYQQTVSNGQVINVFVVKLPKFDVGRYVIWLDENRKTKMTIAPRKAYLPPHLENGGSIFGLSTQLYAQKRRNDQGIGDFTTLSQIIKKSQEKGCDVIAVNPFHMLFNNNRYMVSPYYPSDRRFIEPLYIDINKLGYNGPNINDNDIVDYDAVWKVKNEFLSQYFEENKKCKEFALYAKLNSEFNSDFAIFCAIAEVYGFGKIPEDLWHKSAKAIKEFKKNYKNKILYYSYMQFIAEKQLKEAADYARNMKVGILRDLAVGSSPDGAEKWHLGKNCTKEASIGAPPDPLGPNGQNWGLPPILPLHIIKSAGKHYIDLFQSNMKYAGGLRIDHVMGLMRQFWVPKHKSGKNGAYVNFPFKQLLCELKLESQRNKCLIIGEDLGTVPEGFSEKMQNMNILSYKVLIFEKNGDNFKAPNEYVSHAFTCIGTHDVPPIRGWWEGTEIAERKELGILDENQFNDAMSYRNFEKTKLIEALKNQGLIPQDKIIDFSAEIDDETVIALYAFIGRTPSLIKIAQLKDLAEQKISLNLPGTDKERPNWRYKIKKPIDEIFADELSNRIFGVLGSVDKMFCS